MISNMQDGWCDITIFGYTFPHRASYMNDYPTEIADALLDAAQEKHAEFIVDMEEYGTAECSIGNGAFTVDYLASMIERRTIDIHRAGGICSAMSELLSDIESNWDAMIDWGMPMSVEEYADREKLLREICDELRETLQQ